VVWSRQGDDRTARLRLLGELADQQPARPRIDRKVSVELVDRGVEDAGLDVPCMRENKGVDRTEFATRSVEQECRGIRAGKVDRYVHHASSRAARITDDLRQPARGARPEHGVVRWLPPAQCDIPSVGRELPRDGGADAVRAPDPGDQRNRSGHELTSVAAL